MTEKLKKRSGYYLLYGLMVVCTLSLTGIVHGETPNDEPEADCDEAPSDDTDYCYSTVPSLGCNDSDDDCSPGDGDCCEDEEDEDGNTTCTANVRNKLLHTADDIPERCESTITEVAGIPVDNGDDDDYCGAVDLNCVQEFPCIHSVDATGGSDCTWGDDSCGDPAESPNPTDLAEDDDQQCDDTTT